MTVLPDDEQAWEEDRMELLRERYLKINGAEPAPRGRAWCTLEGIDSRVSAAVPVQCPPLGKL